MNSASFGKENAKDDERIWDAMRDLAAFQGSRLRLTQNPWRIFATRRMGQNRCDKSGRLFCASPTREVCSLLAFVASQLRRYQMPDAGSIGSDHEHARP
jgi:hypothetical protein